MIRPTEEMSVYLCHEAVDFRKSINGLSILVEELLALDPFGQQLFVFRNRRRNMMKLLYWERNGFVLWLKRLEKDRFPWPRESEEVVFSLSGRELNWLLDGIDIFAQTPHGSLRYTSTR